MNVLPIGYFGLPMMLMVITLDLSPLWLNGQSPATPAVSRFESFDQRNRLAANSLFARVPYRNIGPVVQSGRVVDVEVNPEKPSEFWVAFASGGLWKTQSNGSNFTPYFDHEVVMTIGDIAVNWQHNLIWVGTGEVNSSRSSYAGVGMYLSRDGGSSWIHMGLEESHHIGRIVLHPTDPNTVWVAVLGHLYSANAERGVYKTIDGGQSWKKVLFIDDYTGAIDLVTDPADPDILYAAMWHRQRTAWNLVESGSSSAIYKSSDGGDTWENINVAGSGFPTGDGVGRIGLSAVRAGNETWLYAILDNQSRKDLTPEKKNKDLLTKDDIRHLSKEDFLKLDIKKLDQYLKKNHFPDKYKAEEVMRMVRSDKIKPIALVEYLENANAQLFDTDIIGAQVYWTANGGKTWSLQNTYDLDGVYNTYGYYFGQIRTVASDPKKIYIMGVPLLRSTDAGKTWKSLDADNVHVDHHALWVNPDLEGHLINGNDGGVNISYDDGKTWFKCNTPPVGQFYAINADRDDPYNVYGGLQDNGVWVGSNKTEINTAWHQSGQYEFRELMGGDGMQVMIDPRDNQTVYTGFQFGSYFRINKISGRSDFITPRHELGERPLRFNWQTPIWLSRHNPDILYLGAHKVYRTMNKGRDWEALSGDLTLGGKKGDVPFGTLTTLHESPLKFGLLYAGSDDGLIHVSRDGGDTWNPISSGLPQGLWVSRVTASQHEKGRVYITLNGYREDHFDAYVFVSEDYGANWKRLGQGSLPNEPINVIKEDPENSEILYVGGDHGLYISLDSGMTFMKLCPDMPAVPVHDLVVQEDAKELIVGTHGRSLYLIPLEHIQLLKDTLLSEMIYVFEPEKVYHSERWGAERSKWEPIKDPEKTFVLYAKNPGTLQITVRSDEGLLLKRWTEDCVKGLNYPIYHLDVEEEAIREYEKERRNKEKKAGEELILPKADSGKFYLLPGKYKVQFELNGSRSEKELTVETRGRS